MLNRVKVKIYLDKRRKGKNTFYTDGSKRLRLFTRVTRAHSSHARLVKAARMKGAKLREVLELRPAKALFAKRRKEKVETFPPERPKDFHDARVFTSHKYPIQIISSLRLQFAMITLAIRHRLTRNLMLAHNSLTK